MTIQILATVCVVLIFATLHAVYKLGKTLHIAQEANEMVVTSGLVIYTTMSLKEASNKYTVLGNLWRIGELTTKDGSTLVTSREM